MKFRINTRRGDHVGDLELQVKKFELGSKKFTGKTFADNYEVVVIKGRLYLFDSTTEVLYRLEVQH